MTRKFATVAAVVTMTVAGNGWAEEEEKPYVEPKLYTSAPNYGPERPCPHYTAGCRDKIGGWLEHLDAEEEEPMRVALYSYAYRNARKESIAAHRTAAMETKKALLEEDEQSAKEKLTKDEMAQEIAKTGIGAFLTAAAEHKAVEDARKAAEAEGRMLSVEEEEAIRANFKE